MEHILKKIQGETLREEKTRFKAALNEVDPYMDHFYSRMTARRFPNRELSHIRNVRQRAIIDWDVLAFWFEEFLPQPVNA
ncbi:hypothetical protein [Hymenobacter sp. GOD-10R]|uniref:hypothetical protein n=1 Tax=Hymenobacter sp. GOD-10R TaxID=3093922 RepID=UPI002D7878D1|nr:hypothetical protein [Hymenobacter sp. GOD-10R]WRQ26711.1 hypothetical protein SD425_16685 [Hymenobacter sp. GOD-10R]